MDNLIDLDSSRSDESMNLIGFSQSGENDGSARDDPMGLISLVTSENESENVGEYVRPQTYEEQCQLAAQEFAEWRHAGVPVIWKPSDVHRYRDRWQGIKLPRSGQPLLWGGALERWPWGKEPYHIGLKANPPDLDNPWPDPNPRIEYVKVGYKAALNYFGNKDDRFFTFQKVLGFGGLGLALHYKYQGVEPVKDIAVKLSTKGWIADDIRREEHATKAMAGAAHCIQLIDKKTLGLEETEFRPVPDDLDSSDDESSGDDSMDEANARPPRKPRSTLTQEELDAKKRRRDAHDNDLPFERLASRHARKSGRKDYMLLEYVEGGSLVNLISKLQEKEKASGTKVVIPNRVLWALWLCMIRACVAMKYPPRKFHPLRHEWHNSDVPTDLIELVPGENKRWRKKNWVHFDIDPTNIFVGNIELFLAPGERREHVENPRPDRDDDEHKIIPRFKLADFGLMEEIKPYKRNVYYAVKRRTGKNNYLAPEQFAAEWDKIPPTKDGGEVGEQRIAGNYGSPMNVYQMALTLWVVITQLAAPAPVEPQLPVGMNVERDADGLIPSYVDQLVDSTDPNTRISYCPLLLDATDNPYTYIDIELRTAIYECMYHRQDDRPTVETLLEQARRGAQKPFMGESDAVIKAWVDEFLFNAPTSTGDSPGLGSTTRYS